MSHESLDRSDREPPRTKVLQLASLNELLSHEQEIVRRIRAKPHGGRLLLLDPLRLFREILVELSPRAIEETERAYPGFFSSQDHGRAYELVSKSTAGSVRVSLQGLFPKVSR